jgi:hypothetical protein
MAHAKAVPSLASKQKNRELIVTVHGSNKQQVHILLQNNSLSSENKGDGGKVQA